MRLTDMVFWINHKTMLKNWWVLSKKLLGIQLHFRGIFGQAQDARRSSQCSNNCRKTEVKSSAQHLGSMKTHLYITVIFEMRGNILMND